MPCYEVRTVSVEFKVGNIELLKKSLENLGIKIQRSTEKTVSFYNVGELITINLETQKIVGSRMNEKQLTTFSNAIKRSYSEQVIDEIAKKQKWMKRKLGQNKFQLKRF
jgi:hypothetical protein